MNWIQAQYLTANRLTVEAMRSQWKKIEISEKVVSESDLNEVKGLGEASVQKLFEAGINSQKQLKTKTKEELKDIIKNPLTLKNIMTFIEWK